MGEKKFKICAVWLAMRAGILTTSTTTCKSMGRSSTKERHNFCGEVVTVPGLMTTVHEL